MPGQSFLQAITPPEWLFILALVLIAFAYDNYSRNKLN